MVYRYTHYFRWFIMENPIILGNGRSARATPVHAVPTREEAGPGKRSQWWQWLHDMAMFTHHHTNSVGWILDCSTISSHQTWPRKLVLQWNSWQNSAKPTPQALTGMKALKVIHVRLGQFLPCRTWSKRVKTWHLAVDFHSFDDPKRSHACHVWPSFDVFDFDDSSLVG